jgi:hypothetical protein
MVTSAIERSLISYTVFPERGGFWRRAAAFVVDLIVVGLALLSATIPAYDLSGGRVQAAPELGIFTHTICLSLRAVPLGFEVPTELRPNYARDCVSDVFGHPVMHAIVVGRETEPLGVPTDESVTFRVDKEGRPVRLPSLDLFVLPATIVWRWWLDRRKGSLGRWIFGVRVSVGQTEATPASLGRLAMRYGAFALIFAPAWLAELYEDLSPGVGITGLLILATVVAIVRRDESFYDRIAGTRVMRVRPWSQDEPGIPRTRDTVTFQTGNAHAQAMNSR